MFGPVFQSSSVQLRRSRMIVRNKAAVVLVLVLALSLISFVVQFQVVIKKNDDLKFRNLLISNSTFDDLPIYDVEAHVPSSRPYFKEQDTAILQEAVTFKKQHFIMAQRSELGSQQNRSRAGQGRIHLPGIHTYLPHLAQNPEYLNPDVIVSQHRSGVHLVIGVPTVKRPLDQYLYSTLNSIIMNLHKNDWFKCLIIVSIAEPWDSLYVERQTADLKKQYKSHIDSGLLEIIAPKAEFYPDLSDLPQTLKDNKERVRWRTKQNLDYVFLMLHAYTRGEFYIQLEDDIITKRDYYKSIVQTMILRGDGWFVIKCSPLGFIGKLFHTRDLPLLVEFLLMFYKEKPVDWLLDNILFTKVCGKDMVMKECLAQVNKIAIDIRPSLFQHVGYHSSLKGKVQKLKDKSFHMNPLDSEKLMNLKQNLNPTPMSIDTSISVYNNHKVEYAYVGRGYFWGATPVKGDVIDFIYEPPINISRYTFVSGHPSHPNDRFASDTTVEVETMIKVRTKNKQKTIETQLRKFQVVGYFDNNGVAEGQLSPSLGSVQVLRIHVNSNMTTWVILSSITVVGT